MASAMDAVGHSVFIGQHLYIRATNATAKAGETEAPKPTSYKIIGLVLAIASGLFIGVSFVLKKHGLLKANEKYNEEAGEGYGYLKNFWWWTGMTLMILGEICNFAAYLFASAILVTPLGALSVVVTAILSSIFLKERLSFVGKVGCFLCIVGSVVIAANAPEQASVTNIQGMQKLVLTPGFLSFMGVILIGCAVVAFWLGPKYGKKSMMVYLTVCSLIGGLSVSCIQGIGAAITAQAKGEAQFNKWFTYVLLIFVIATLVTEIIFLNKALNLYNAALVTPTYYVYFTSATIITSAVLYQGFKGTAIQILDVVLGFLVICGGVVLLQLSKSAKDVPDTAVFKGDLDQVRTVAEVEEPDYEPKADAIRGGSAIIRSFSKARQSKQMEEAKRLRQEHNNAMRPIGEDERIEFDGIRRRRTTISSRSAVTSFAAPPTPALGGSASVKRKSTHPPLGMSRHPDDEEDALEHSEMHPGFFHFLHRNRSSKTLPPTPAVESVPLSPVKSGDSHFDDDDVAHPRSYFAGLKYPPGIISHSDDPYHKSPHIAQIQFAAEPLSTEAQYPRPMHLPPPPSVPSQNARPTTPVSARRQFSFQNVFHKRRASSEKSQDPAQGRPASRGAMSFMSRNASKTSKTGGETEEERMGLVKGDSESRLSGSPPSYLDHEHRTEHDDWHLMTHAAGSSPRDARPVLEESFVDVEPSRLPRYTASPSSSPTRSPLPADTIRRVGEVHQQQQQQQQDGRMGLGRGGQQRGSSAEDEKGSGGGAFI